MKCLLCGLKPKFDPLGYRDSGWDWFKGYRRTRAEFCPNCVQTRQPEIQKIYTASRQKPTAPIVTGK